MELMFFWKPRHDPGRPAWWLLDDCLGWSHEQQSAEDQFEADTLISSPQVITQVVVSTSSPPQVNSEFSPVAVRFFIWLMDTPASSQCFSPPLQHVVPQVPYVWAMPKYDSIWRIYRESFSKDTTRDEATRRAFIKVEYGWSWLLLGNPERWSIIVNSGW